MRPIPGAMGLSALASLLLCAGCGGDARTAAAVAAFEHFQDALFARDAAAVRALVTRESAPVVDAMPWDRIATQPRLQAIDASDERGSYHVRVRDPQRDSGLLDAYVVVRELGELKVDLVATAALYSRQLQPTGDPGDFELTELSPADLDRARRQYHEMPPDQRAGATPPGN